MSVDEIEKPLLKEASVENDKVELAKKRKEIRDDIINDFEAMIHDDPKQCKAASPYRYWLHGSLYNGKYKHRLSDGLGYQKEYKAHEDFVLLVNRLFLSFPEIYRQFVDAYKNGDGSEVQVLLDEFAKLSRKKYEKLNHERGEYVFNLTAAKAIEEDDIFSLLSKEKNDTQNFIESIIDYESENENDDYGCLSKKINQLKKDSPESARLTVKYIREIRKARQTLIRQEASVHAELRVLKKATNHYLRSLDDENRRIVSLNNIDGKYKLSQMDEEKERKRFEEKYQIARMDDERYRSLEQSISEKKRLHRKAANTVAQNVGVGEGTVAGVGMYGFLMLTVPALAPAALPLGILTGLAGMFCNYYLVRDDTYGILNQLRIKNMLGKLSTVEQDIAVILGLSSLAVGFVYGALSASSLYGAVAPLLAKIGLSHALALALGVSISSFPVLFTTVGMAAILFFVISDFIKNERWLGIKNFWLENFWDLGWSEMTGKERFFQALNCSGRILKVLLGLSINVVITVASFGVFHGSGVKLLSIIASANIADKMAWVMAGINAAISINFGIAKVAQTLAPVDGNLLKKIAVGLLLLLPRLMMLLGGALFKFAASTLLGLNLVELALLAEKVLVNTVTYSLQFLLTTAYQTMVLIPKLVRLTLALFPAAVMLVASLITVAMVVVRSALSLLVNLGCFVAAKIGGWKYQSTDIIHRIFKPVITEFIDKTGELFATVIKALSLGDKYLKENCLADTVVKCQNKLTDVRHGLNNGFSTLLQPLLEKTQSLYRQACEWAHLTEKPKEGETPIENVHGLVRSFVDLFSRFFQFTILLNGMGQGMLATKGGGAFPKALVATVGTFNSVAPNNIAAEGVIANNLNV